MKLSVREITKLIKGQLILGDPAAVATSAAVDSRAVQPGTLFFALKGERADGHDFVVTAARRKATAAVVSHLNWFKNDNSVDAAVIKVENVLKALQTLGRSLRLGFKGPVVGITGSNGKTTTKQMVESVLKVKSPGLATQGNFNSQIGLPLVISLLQPEHEWIVLEMGASAPGNIAGLAEIGKPTIGILTSIGPAHLATFGSLQRVAETKWELMESLPQDGTAIVPWSESILEPLIRAFKKKLVFFGEDSSCPIRASSIQATEKVKFMLHVGSRSSQVQLPLPGRVNVMNALAAAAAGWTLGYSLEEIVQGLQSFEPPKMRMEVTTHASGSILINDAYNANPASMIQAARSLSESYPDRERVMVVGSMLELGPDSDMYHFNLGVDLGRFSLNHVYLLGNETKPVFEGAKSVKAEARFTQAESMQELIGKLQGHLNKKTAILFKGSRGIKLEQAIEALQNPPGSLAERV